MTTERRVLVHADRADLHRIAAFDALTNNADRKGGHVILDADDRLWCIDHGVSFHVDDKLRTVLGDRFVDVYAAIKDLEHQEFMTVISPWEREHLLLHV